MPDPKLDSLLGAVRGERYQTHLEKLPGHLDLAARRPGLPPRRRGAWAVGMLLVIAAAGFIPVQNTETSGYLISGRTELHPTSEALEALEALTLPAPYNLSVSSDTSGTTFALYLHDSGQERIGSWTERVESAVAPTNLRVRMIEVVNNRPLWVKALGRAGVTISASGRTRAEIQAQVDAQLELLGSGQAQVEDYTDAEGERSVRITVQDTP